MRHWLQDLWTRFVDRRYARRLQHDRTDELEREDELGHAKAGIHYPRGGGMGL
jgi:hypothetical protein